MSLARDYTAVVPDEVLLNVLQRVPRTHLTALSKVNRRWLTLVRDPTLWRVFDRSGRQDLDKETLQRMPDWRRRAARTISFKGVVSLDDAAFAACWPPSSVPSQLHTIFLDWTNISDASMVLLTARAPGLRRVSIGGCTQVTDAGAAALALASQLEHLTITGTRVSEHGLAPVIRHCTRLHTLHANMCRNLTRATLVAVARNARSLVRITMLGCKHVDDEAIAGMLDPAACTDVIESHLHDPTCIDDSAQLGHLFGSRLSPSPTKLVPTPGSPDAPGSPRDWSLPSSPAVRPAGSGSNSRRSSLEERVVSALADRLHGLPSELLRRNDDALPAARRAMLSSTTLLPPPAPSPSVFLPATLTELALGETMISDAAVISIAAALHGLRRLNLSQCVQVTDVALDALASNCRALNTLGLRNTRVTDAGVHVIAAHCSQLQDLNLSCNINITDEALLSLAQHAPRLRVLHLARCTNVTDAGVGELVQDDGDDDGDKDDNKDDNNNVTGCVELEVLGLKRCRAITGTGLVRLTRRLRRLRDLDLSRTRISDSSLAAVLEASPHLQILRVDGCSDVTDAAFDVLADDRFVCPPLSVLNVAGTDISDELLHVLGDAECASLLSDLDLSRTSVTDDALRVLARRMPSISKLKLVECLGIGNDALVPLSLCPLTTLNLSGCALLDADSVAAMTRSSTSLRYRCQIALP